ncbi:phosphoglycerate mutase family protein [Mytilinidion resinicola]|uniref:Phosphoglycerate mutase family protein n=1 Tax=Mytilinidion resinicola TaxID=574789 RepID=A0A6A6Z6W6_9PEZI|nr:phosphoglycerate mutase family protein [Mytilinidion resinicola]KAF2816044.1 phosphoglycerate mutase family protein [Mytilinidion resinicola]
MVLETIYVLRHANRVHYNLDSRTGVYSSAYGIANPTGLGNDPVLAAHGVEQSIEFANHVLQLDPPVDIIYSSPFYRCLQTLTPALETIFAQRKEFPLVRVENGIGEFFGRAHFHHPSPAPPSVLLSHFPSIDPTYTPIITPATNGETIPGLHDRLAYALYRMIMELDDHPAKPRSVLICSHAATIIAVGRVLTGRMPENESEHDFDAFTCGLSKFNRRVRSPVRGVVGGWDCELNSDCSFLAGGQEYGWHFNGDESFIDDKKSML